MNTRDLGTRPPGYIGAHPVREAATSHPASLNHEVVATTPDYGDGRIAIERSFTDDIESRVEALRNRFTVRSLGSIEYGPHIYPLYEIAAIQNPQNTFVRLSGIVHGDEPAGGKAILSFFEQNIERYLKHFNFLAIPCVNPSGYEACSLQAMNGYHPEYRSNKNTGNINRSFGSASDQQEARLIEASLKEGPSRYLLSMDMHECTPYYTDEVYTPKDAPKAAWVYESCCTEGRRIGRALVDSLPHDIEVCTWEKIYSDWNDGGVIPFHPTTTSHAEYHEPTSLDGHLFAHYTGHSFTTETPTGWKLEKRIRAQLHFLTYILDTYIKRLEDETLDVTSPWYMALLKATDSNT